jgi:hypothetical protein
LKACSGTASCRTTINQTFPERQVNKRSFRTKLIYLWLFYHCFLDTQTKKVRLFLALFRVTLIVQECVTDKHLDINLISDVFLAVGRTGFHIIRVPIFCFLVLGTNFAVKKTCFNID